MKRLTLAIAVLAAVCASAAVAAQKNQAQFIMHDVPGSQLSMGDVLVADGTGGVGLYRGNALVATLHDPQQLVSGRAGNAPLYITDAEGNVVRGSLQDFSGDLFLSDEAPQIVYYKREFVQARAQQHLSHPKAHGSGSGGGGSADMTLHGGNVLTSNKTMAIFWGSWGNPGDIISGIDTFFQGWGNSGMASDSTEYYGTTNGNVTASSSYLGHAIDSSTPPRRALSTSQAVSEACTMTNNNPDPDGVYFIYTSTGAGHASYCAWHSWGSCSNGKSIQVAYMPNITGLAGCDPQSTVSGESQGLAALANVTSHELSEAITDPRGAGWFDSGGAENGDKCAWSFHNNVSLSNGNVWKLQMEWSNHAYDTSSGYANSSGQKGCLQ